jgi:ribosomal protein S18
MPYKIRKLPNTTKVRVYRHYGTSRMSIVAKRTTLKKAKSQVRLLNAIDHGFKPSK